MYAVQCNLAAIAVNARAVGLFQKRPSGAKGKNGPFSKSYSCAFALRP